MTAPMPQDAPERIQVQAQKQDSDPATALRRLIQCHANPGANWAERCLALVDEMAARIAELELNAECHPFAEGLLTLAETQARLASGDATETEP
jgi:hypothetical protein